MVHFGCCVLADLEGRMPAIDLRRRLRGLAEECEGERGTAEDIHGINPVSLGDGLVFATSVGVYGVNTVHYSCKWVDALGGSIGLLYVSK